MSKKLKVLGLALIVVCAFGAVSASAQAAPKFTVEGLTSGTVKIAEEATVTPSGAKLTLTVPELLTITCSTLTVNDGTIKVGTDENSASSLSFGGCTVDTPEGEPTTCKVKNTGGTNGTILTGGLTSTLIEKAGAGYITFTPAAGGTFVEIQITECGLATKAKVTGTASVKIVSPAVGVLATSAEIEASKTVAVAAGTKLLFGSRESFLDGKADLRLESGAKWGYDF